MKREQLVKMIRREAKRRGLTWKPGEGGRHSVYWLGDTKIPIPRHTEIGEGLTQAILHECENELGKGWWRK